MAFSLLTILTIMVLFTGVINGSSNEWTITPSHTFAIAGKDFNLTCETGLKAARFLTWYRNGNLIRYYPTNCEYQHTNESQKYEFFCTSMTSFTVVIPATVIDDEHGSQWYCSGDKSVGAVVIKVFYEPDRNLTLTGYDGYILRPEQYLTLLCNSNGGRPWADLSWTCGGKSLEGLNFNSSDKFVSELTLRLNESLSGQVCTCIATHPLWETPVETSTFPLRIYYASTEAPYITGYTGLRGIREGERINLTCTVFGGYPLPSLTWICGDTVMDTLNKSTEAIATIVLSLFVNRTFHEQQCICNGTSPANYSRTTNVSFIVNYQPTVTLIYEEEQFLNEINYNMFCKVDEGNPTGYNITWSQIFSNTVVRTNANFSSLLSNNGHNLTLTRISYKDMGIYTCSVHNNVTDLNGNLLQNKSVSIQTNVSAVFVSPKVFQAYNGEPFVVEIPFYCRPKVNSILDLKWFKKDKNKQHKVEKSDVTFAFEAATMKIPFYGTLVTVNGQVAVMTIQLVNNSTAGDYVLSVQNVKSFGFTIEVKDPTKNSTLIEDTMILPLAIGIPVGIVAVIVIVVIVWRCTQSENKGKTNRKKDFTGKQELNRDSNPYAEIKAEKATKVTGRPRSNPYSEPWTGRVQSRYYVNTNDDIQMPKIPPYANVGSIPANNKDGYSNPYAEIKDNKRETKSNPYSEPSSLPINTTANDDKPMAKVNPLSDTQDKQNSCSDPKEIFITFQEPTEKEGIIETKPDPMYAEVKKPKRIEKVAEVVNNNGENQQEVKKPNNTNEPKNGCQDNTDNDSLQKGEIKKVIKCEDESKKPSPTEENDETAANTEQHAKKNAEEVKDGLDYVELELSEQNDENTAINSKASKVNYAEIKTEAYRF